MVKVKVGLNQQQKQLIENLRREKQYGETFPEIIRAVFKEWMKEAGHLDSEIRR